MASLNAVKLLSNSPLAYNLDNKSNHAKHHWNEASQKSDFKTESSALLKFYFQFCSSAVIFQSVQIRGVLLFLN